MATFQSNIPGMKQLIDKIERTNKALAVDVVEILDQGTINIEKEARAVAPVGNSGRLKNSISADISDKYSKSVNVDVPYGAFVEFGTGSNVFRNRQGFVFAPDVREFAKEFYVNGLGRMQATPYLFPAFESEKLRIIAQIKQLFGL